MRLGPRCYRIRTRAAADFERQISSLHVQQPVPSNRLRAVPVNINRHRAGDPVEADGTDS
jgi:hypothetical protein